MSDIDKFSMPTYTNSPMKKLVYVIWEIGIRRERELVYVPRPGGAEIGIRGPAEIGDVLVRKLGYSKNPNKKTSSEAQNGHFGKSFFV